MRKLLGSGIRLGFLIVFAAIGARLWGFLSHGSGDSAPRTVLYEVKRNASPSQIARDLERRDVVSNAWVFHWYGRLTRQNGKIKAGEYRFTTAMPPQEVFRILASGISFGTPLIIPEGYTIAQIADVFEGVRAGAKKEVMLLARDKKFIASIWPRIWRQSADQNADQSAKKNPPRMPSTLEGYLFPDTYSVTRGEKVADALAAMAAKSARLWTPLWFARARELGLTVHETLTLASIVEKETGADFERPLVSSVFHNRLRKRMRLQTDPTVIYGIKNYRGNITRKDLETPSPYNTYLIAGLPPGPIANPGRAAIEAALFPKETTYLYFSSHNDGTHEFTSTYEEHQRAVAKFQLDPKEREGKSWRDLGKRKAMEQDGGGR